jgi:hypothetical protein
MMQNLKQFTRNIRISLFKFYEAVFIVKLCQNSYQILKKIPNKISQDVSKYISEAFMTLKFKA